MGVVSCILHYSYKDMQGQNVVNRGTKLFLPVTINKMLKFEYLEDGNQFLDFWVRQNPNLILRSSSFYLNPETCKSAVHFKRYIKNLHLLNPEDEYGFSQGKNDLYMGAIFSIRDDTRNRFLLRITVKPAVRSEHQEVMFQVGLTNRTSENMRLAEYVIQTYCFLFQ